MRPPYLTVGKLSILVPVLLRAICCASAPDAKRGHASSAVLLRTSPESLPGKPAQQLHKRRQDILEEPQRLLSMALQALEVVESDEDFPAEERKRLTYNAQMLHEQLEALVPSKDRVHSHKKQDGTPLWASPRGQPDWAAGPEGGSDKTSDWDRNKDRRGWGPWTGAIIFIGLIGTSPVIPHLKRNAEPPTRIHYFESALMFLWLCSGLYMFTNQIIFQSPHFKEPRVLSVEEAVYLMSQIVTTVGYGDITPADINGQAFVGAFVLLATVVISQVLGELVSTFQNEMEDLLMDDEFDDDEEEASNRKKLWASFVPVVQSGGVFLIFLVIGTAFFHLFPGEGKTVGQGIYMSLITLSSVGFGAFTPTTHGGMVFAAFWMLFGVGALVRMVAARVAFATAMVNYERDRPKCADDQVDPDSPRQKIVRAAVHNIRAQKTRSIDGTTLFSPSSAHQVRRRTHDGPA